MAAAVNAGAQAALMAPTEILAEQHAAKIQQMLPETEVRLLTGSLSAGDKEAIYEELESGRAEIVIGTHALIQEGVAFANLGLVVIDEQHRFGVEQRGRVAPKRPLPPDMLVMTATPIPRSLAPHPLRRPRPFGDRTRCPPAGKKLPPTSSPQLPGNGPIT